jgi:DNA-directed RNA polymerase subunit RPC12/RpoP
VIHTIYVCPECGRQAFYATKSTQGVRHVGFECGSEHFTPHLEPVEVVPRETADELAAALEGTGNRIQLSKRAGEALARYREATK